MTTFRRLRSACALGLAAGALAATAANASAFKSAPCDVPGMRELILQQVNAARAAGAVCGATRFKVARSLAWNDQLQSAAAGHSRDMAEQGFFDHQNPRGSRPADRVHATGYKWRSVGENIAAGDPYTYANVVAGWMASPDHCSNIMDPGFAEVAVACVARPGSAYGSYWTMVLGRR